MDIETILFYYYTIYICSNELHSEIKYAFEKYHMI